ncbi:hypothetical protein Vadar_008000 [Vaccinium darrowii]|uniref:Uncharacterized protein n=1 Tax=Vaccinium darrowii TaxID=229202 RepID=A0ACB7YU59_9ERIC|nr:hypothetical protein Vadar_008000 [Vaccinium darrowii]
MALRCVYGRSLFLLSVKPQIKLGICGGGVTVRNHSDHGCFSPQSREDPSVGEKSPQPHPFVIHPRRHAVVIYYRNPLSGGKTGGAGGITPFYGSLSDPEVVEPSLSAIEQYNKQQNKELKFVALLEASIQVVCGIKYYLTLEAFDAGATAPTRPPLPPSLYGRSLFLLSVKPQIKLEICGGGVPVRNHSDHGCFSPQSREDPSVGEKSPQPHPFVIHPRRHAVVIYYRNPLSDGKSGGAGGITPFYGSLSDPEVVEPSLSAIEQYNKQQNKELKFVALLEASIQIVCGRKFYLTVEALDAAMKPNVQAGRVIGA